MEKTTISIQDYINSLEEKHQSVMRTLIDMVYKAAPDIEYAVWRGVFWSGSEQTILGFGEYAYQAKNGDSGTWFKIGLARQKNYYSIYVAVAKNGQYITKAYKDQLGKVKTGASSISFTKLENVDLEKLQQLLNEATRL